MALRARVLTAAAALFAISAPWAASAQGPAADGARVAELARAVTSEDAAVRRGALAGLEAMGREGVAALLELLVEPGAGDDAGVRMALHGLAVLAGRPGADEWRREFVEASVAFLRSDRQHAAKCFVIAQLELVGDDESVAILGSLAADPQVSDCACRALVAIGTPAARGALRSALGTARGPARVAVIQAIGEVRDAEAVDLLLAEANTGDETGLAAVEALGRVGSPGAASAIAELIRTAAPRERRAAFEAYLLLAEGIMASGDRGLARQLCADALELADSPAALCAALDGLARAGSAADVPLLVRYMNHGDHSVRRAAVRGLAELQGEDVVPAIARAMAGAETALRLELLSVLAARKDPTALGVIEEAANDPSPEVRVISHHILGRLDDPSLEETLIEAARSGSEPVHEVALAAYLRLADAAARTDRARAAAMCHLALAAARTDATRRLVLRALRGVADTDSLALVEPLANIGALRVDAIEVYVAVARRLRETGQDEPYRDMLLTALGMGPPRHLASEIAQELRAMGVDADLARHAGFVTSWWLLGPIRGQEIGRDLPPEHGVYLGAPVSVDGSELHWKRYLTDDPSGVVPLRQLMDPSEDTTAYAYAEVIVDQPVEATLKAGSDDGVVVWLNGERVLRSPQPRGLQVDEDAVDVQLVAGANTILAKIVQGGGDWSFCLRLVDREGRPLVFAQKVE